MSRRRLRWFILIAVVIRILIVIIAPISKSMMNPDEERNFNIARNHLNGKGYTVFDTQQLVYVKSAFHSSFPVFIYEFLIRNNIGKQAWINFIYLISFLLYAVSIEYFYKLAFIFYENKKFAYYSTALYSFYPSVIYFVGALFFYESLSLYGLIIIVYSVVRLLKTGTIRKTDYILIPAFSAIVILFRPQLIPVLIVFFSVVFILMLWGKHWLNGKQKLYFIKMMFITTVAIIVVHLPALNKNKQMFGQSVLSTQYGFEFLQGHNPLAKGSWLGNWRDSASTFYKYVHSRIPELGSLDELQESNARRKLALEWIKENPKKEIELMAKKCLIYFLPYNFDVLPGYKWINPINLIIHLLFFCYLVYNLYRRSFTYYDLLLVSIVIATIIISLVFFVVYRMRFFAEPFILLFALKFLLQWKERKRPAN